MGPPYGITSDANCGERPTAIEVDEQGNGRAEESFMTKRRIIAFAFLVASILLLVKGFFVARDLMAPTELGVTEILWDQNSTQAFKPLPP
jgi:hypothetical protein